MPLAFAVPTMLENCRSVEAFVQTSGCLEELCACAKAATAHSRQTAMIAEDRIASFHPCRDRAFTLVSKFINILLNPRFQSPIHRMENRLILLQVELPVNLWACMGYLT